MAGTSCIDQVRLIRFTADRTQINAGDEVLLRWEVFVPPGCSATIHLNERRVQNSGSLTVAPLQNVAYRLFARVTLSFKTLSTIQISVDNSGCREADIAESVVAQLIDAAIDSTIEETNQNGQLEGTLRKRRENLVELESSGIVIRIRLSLLLDNLPNPTIAIDAKIDLRTTPEGRPIAFYRSFSIDIDLPGWVTLLSPSTLLILEKIEDLYEPQLKTTILNAIMPALEEAVGGFTVGSIQTDENRILITLC